MPEYLVKTLKVWNTQPDSNASLEIDKKFVDLLLVCFIGLRNLSDEQVDLKFLRFVRGLLNAKIEKFD